MYRYVVLFLICWSTQISAQFGFKAVNTWPQQRIAETVTNNKLFPTLLGVGVDYWFRLKNYRLEFLPALHAQYAHERIQLDQSTSGQLTWLITEFVPGVQFYPLDFKNDCNCPTFSKQGEFFKKGFFITLAPGVAYSALTGKQTQVGSIHEFLLFGRAGAGIDIGISDLLTLSPSVNYQISEALDWRALFLNPGTAKMDLYSGLFMSIRVGWRLDKKNY